MSARAEVRERWSHILLERSRRALRVHLGPVVAAGLGTVQDAITAALENRRRQAAAAAPPQDALLHL